MRRTLSSRQTFFAATLLPLLFWAATMALFLVMATRPPGASRAAQVAFGLFALAWGALALINCGQMFRMKKVAVDSRFLYVSTTCRRAP